MIRFVYRHDITIDLVVWHKHVGAAKDVSARQTLHGKRSRSRSMSACGSEPCATRTGWSLGALVNSEELLLDLPAHLPCDMSLPAMWRSLPD